MSAIRCTVAAGLMSAVVGGLVYGTAESKFQQQMSTLREVAGDTCMSAGPPKAPQTEDDLIKLDRLQRVCAFAETGQPS